MCTRSSEACALHTTRGSQSADGSFTSADLSHGADSAANPYLSLRERHTMSGDMQNLALAARHQPRGLPSERQAPGQHPQDHDSGSSLSGSNSEKSFARSPLSLRQRHTMSSAIQSLTFTANQALASAAQQRPQQQQQQQQQQPMRRPSAPLLQPPPEATGLASGARRFLPQLQRFESADQATTIPRPTATVVSQSLFELLASCQQQGEALPQRMQLQRVLAPAPAAAADDATSTATTLAAAVPNVDPPELAAPPAAQAHTDPDRPQGQGRLGAEDAHRAMAAAHAAAAHAAATPAAGALKPAALRTDPAQGVPSPRRRGMKGRARQATAGAADPLRVAASHIVGPVIAASSVSAQEHPRKSSPTVSQVRHAPLCSLLQVKLSAMQLSQCPVRCIVEVPTDVRGIVEGDLPTKIVLEQFRRVVTSQAHKIVLSSKDAIGTLMLDSRKDNTAPMSHGRARTLALTSVHR